MISLKNLSPTHGDTAVAVGGYGIKRNQADKEPAAYAVRVALDGTADTMTVKIPYDRRTKANIGLFTKTIRASPFSVCGVVFENMQIRHYEYTDPKSKTVRSGYTATATNIKSVIP